jgi:hypothetical protein
MSNQSLILIMGSHRYRITSLEYKTVDISDIPYLLHKPISAVWNWARMHHAKVYFEQYLPRNLVICPSICQPLNLPSLEM